ncbi:site-2 protease family protein [Bacillus sp. NPDC077027]|uniref:site-2 protease family protein n=1 Tax=Bacillus sp. NPDC077027 TaxID=3390548 RepID=UPI003CFD903F
MFTLSDMWTFCWSFFLILPLVAILHQLGHIFVARIFGAKVSFAIGRGKRLVTLGVVEIRRIYFLDAFCHYEEMRKNSRFTHILVYLGGSFLNMMSVLLLNTLIANDFLPEHPFFYQFAYFSIYYVFFALLPVQFSENHPSDGQAIINIIRHGEPCDIID